MEHLYIKFGDPSNGGFFLDIVRINRHSQIAAKNVPPSTAVGVGIRPMSHMRFYRAILSRNFTARQNCSMQLCMSHTVTLSHKQGLTNQLGQCLFTRQSRSVRHAQLRAATLSRDELRDKIAP